MIKKDMSIPRKTDFFLECSPSLFSNVKEEVESNYAPIPHVNRFSTWSGDNVVLKGTFCFKIKETVNLKNCILAIAQYDPGLLVRSATYLGPLAHCGVGIFFFFRCYVNHNNFPARERRAHKTNHPLALIPFEQIDAHVFLAIRTMVKTFFVLAVALVLQYASAIHAEPHFDTFFLFLFCF